MKKFLLKTFIIFCVLFTITTLASSIINIVIKNPIETHVHIIDRAFLTLIGSFILNLLMAWDGDSKIIKFFLPYLTLIVLAMFYVFVSGYFTELHKSAYKDIFLNVSVVYFVVYIVLYFVRKR